MFLAPYLSFYHFSTDISLTLLAFICLESTIGFGTNKNHTCMSYACHNHKINIFFLKCIQTLRSMHQYTLNGATTHPPTLFHFSTPYSVGSQRNCKSFIKALFHRAFFLKVQINCSTDDDIDASVGLLLYNNRKKILISTGEGGR